MTDARRSTLRWFAAIGLVVGAGCAPSARPSITKIGDMEGPSWAATASRHPEALEDCLHDLVEPRYVLRVATAGELLAVSTYDGGGEASLCLWSADEGVVGRRPSAVSPEYLARTALLHLGLADPTGPHWAAVEPFMVDGEVLGWIRARVR